MKKQRTSTKTRPSQLIVEQNKLLFSRECVRGLCQHGRIGRPSVVRGLGKEIAAFLLVVLMPLFGALPVRTQTNPPTEYQVKAAFLFNFAKFIDWPPGSFANPQAPFSICILGKDPFGRSIDDALQGKSIGEHTVIIQRVKEAGDARHCQIVFAGGSESRNVAEILERVRGANVLLVGEADGFAASGGTIQFTLEENHVRFLINIDAADRGGLKLSSKLLALAKIVHGGTGDRKS
jgi:YfiR/HmsC-like